MKTAKKKAKKEVEVVRGKLRPFPQSGSWDVTAVVHPSGEQRVLIVAVGCTVATLRDWHNAAYCKITGNHGGARTNVILAALRDYWSDHPTYRALSAEQFRKAYLRGLRMLSRSALPADVREVVRDYAKSAKQWEAVQVQSMPEKATT